MAVGEARVPRGYHIPSLVGHDTRPARSSRLRSGRFVPLSRSFIHWVDRSQSFHGVNGLGSHFRPRQLASFAETDDQGNGQGAAAQAAFVTAAIEDRFKPDMRIAPPDK